MQVWDDVEKHIHTVQVSLGHVPNISISQVPLCPVFSLCASEGTKAVEIYVHIHHSYTLPSPPPKVHYMIFHTIL